MAHMHPTRTTGCGTYLVIGILAILCTFASGQVVRLRAVGCSPTTDYPRCAPEAGFPFVFVQDTYSSWASLGHMGVMDWEDYIELQPLPFTANVFVYSVLLLLVWWGVQFRSTPQVPRALRFLAPFATVAIVVLVAGSYNFRPYRPGRLPTPTPIPAQVTDIQQRWRTQASTTDHPFDLEFGPDDHLTLYLPERIHRGRYVWLDASSLTITLDSYAALDTPPLLHCDYLPTFFTSLCQTRLVAYAGPSLEGRLIAPSPPASNLYAAPATQTTVDAVYQQVWGVLRVRVDAATLTLSNDAGVQLSLSPAP